MDGTRSTQRQRKMILTIGEEQERRATNSECLAGTKEERGANGTSNCHHLSVAGFDISLGAASDLAPRKLLLLSHGKAGDTMNDIV